MTAFRFSRHALSLSASLILASCVLTGCGLEAPKAPKPTPAAGATAAAQSEARKNAAEAPAPEFLTDTDLRPYSSRSPERAALELWRSIQNRDILSAYESLTPNFRKEYGKSLTHFGTFVMADYQRWLTKPRIVSSSTQPGRASIFMNYPVKGGVDQRFTFAMRREKGRWRLAYDFYLANRLNGK